MAGFGHDTQRPSISSPEPEKRVKNVKQVIKGPKPLNSALFGASKIRE